MAEGTFKIPLATYYEVSGNLKTKVTELANSVEDDFLNLVSNNIGELDSRDAQAVESFSSYTSAKSKLEKLREHENKLNNMSMEGGNNPLNGVVSTDNEYASSFTGISAESSNSQISVVMGNLGEDIEFAKRKIGFVEFIDNITDDSDRAILANILGIDPADLTTWAKNAISAVTNIDDLVSLLDTLYVGSGKGITFETLLYADEIGKAMYRSKTVERILTAMMDLPYALKSQKWAAAIAKYTGKATSKVGYLKIIGAAVSGDFLAATGKTVKKILESDTVKVGGEAFAWATLGIEEGLNIKSAWDSSKTDSKTTVGKVGKSIIGGTIDTISDVGPLDGMWLGAKVGAASTNPMVAVGGSLIGLGLGTANLVGSAFFPKQKEAIYDGIKDGAYAAVDWTENKVEEVGKAINSGMEKVKSVGKNISNFFNGGAKTVSSWFG